jgi:hypothetical protein
VLPSVTLTEDNTECCYAVQDKVWVQGPGKEPWEIYVVKGDADRIDKATDGECCCGIQDNAKQSVGATTGAPHLAAELSKTSAIATGRQRRLGRG